MKSKETNTAGFYFHSVVFLGVGMVVVGVVVVGVVVFVATEVKSMHRYMY